MPFPGKERKSRFRKNREQNLSVQMDDGGGLSAKSEELLTMADIGAGGRESREDKWLGQGLSTHPYLSCAPHKGTQRALLVTLMKGSVDLHKSAPSIMGQPPHLKAKLMAPTSFSWPPVPVPTSSLTHRTS